MEENTDQIIPEIANFDFVRDIKKAKQIGFRQVKGTIHTSQTILSENAAILIEKIVTSAGVWNRENLTQSIVANNIFGKRTDSARAGALRDMISLYGFDAPPSATKALLSLWNATSNRPLLLGQLAVARDPILRATLPVILSMQPGEAAGFRTMSAYLEGVYPGRFSGGTLRAVGERCISSWGQMGHLRPGRVRERVAVIADSTHAAFASFLAICCGFTGQAILKSGWFRMLDLSSEQAMSLLRRAEAEGQLRLHIAGHVFEISLSGELETLKQGKCGDGFI
jgi:hypothetical protein